ncbi:MAG: protein kinase [Saprospiraceae bacterium]
MPPDLHQPYRLSPFIKILPAQAVYDAANWQDQWILKNERNGRHFTINGTISRFLLFFQRPATLQSVFAKLQLTEEEQNLPVRRQLTDFLEKMLEQNILIKKEEWRDRQRIRRSDQILVLEEQYQVLETFQQFPSHFVCRVKSLKDETEKVIKGLHLQNIPVKNRSTATAKFNNEFAILARVGQHPQICSCLAFDPVRHRAVMPYYRGGTLEDYLREEPFKLDLAWSVWAQIVRIFAYLHGERISHGDPHFDNFIYQPNGELRLIDFTCAADLDDPPEYSGKGAKALLTPPERITPDSLKLQENWINSTRSEVYQLGVMGYYLLYGHYPFSGNTWDEVAECILRQHLDWPAENISGQTIPEEWLFLLQKCLYRETAKRWKDALELSVAISNQQTK